MESERVTAVLRDRESFVTAIQLICKVLNVEKSNGYSIIDGKLFISKYSDKCTKHAYEYNIGQIIDFVWGWYNNNQKPSSTPYNGDGSNVVGCLITTDKCGVGSDDWGMMFMLEPVWIYYGK